MHESAQGHRRRWRGSSTRVATSCTRVASVISQQLEDERDTRLQPFTDATVPYPGKTEPDAVPSGSTRHARGAARAVASFQVQCIHRLVHSSGNQMRTFFLLMLLPVAAHAQAQDATTNAPLVDRKAGRSMVLAFDVEPGSYKQVLLPVDEGEGEDEKAVRVSIQPPTDPRWTAGHWSPSVSLCLRPAENLKQAYCMSLELDGSQAMRTLGSVRLFSASGEQMFRKLTTTRFEPHAKVELRVVRKEEHVTASFDGVTIDDGEIGFTPVFWVIAASTGVATIETVEEVEVPLGPGEWPTTVEAAVALELDSMSGTNKSTLREMRKEEVRNLRIGWGTGIIDRHGLSRGNDALLEDACGKACDPDAASMVIMEAVWSELQAPPDVGEDAQR
jgi:hypothetical protein